MVRTCERNTIVVAYPLRWNDGRLIDANGMELARQREGVPTLDELRDAKREWSREQAERAEQARRVAERAVSWGEGWPTRRNSGYNSEW